MIYNLKLFFEDGSYSAYRGTKHACLMIIGEEEKEIIEITMIDELASKKEKEKKDGELHSGNQTQKSE